ncbi:MAG: phosphatidate cytidylyltransferase [Bacteroidota bacterium]|nr:phosphatidate cytidylyltransferase [Bacteroidota bacterium]
MAFNVQTFKTRAVTAIVFVAVMLAGLLINQWSFFLLFSIIHFGCWMEYQKLVGRIDEAYNNTSFIHKYGVMVLGWFLMIFLFRNNYRIGNNTLSGLGWYLMLLLSVVLLATEVVFKKQLNMKALGYSVVGLLYISLSWALMLNIKALPELPLKEPGLYFDYGFYTPLILIAAIWINDTMAYIVGSFIGKTPFSSISPKKTWEGTIGGALLAIAVVTTGSYYWLHLPVATGIGISAIAAVVGTAGDLLESKIKRMANVKDSGSIMPGHGGFLDRFDSLLLATPFVWLLLWFLLR